jgi:4'-phosphopantetheinyl transferase
MEKESISIQVACLNAAHISDLEFQMISEKVRTWSHVPDTAFNESVQRKNILGRWLTFSLLSMYGITPELMKNITLSAYGKPFLPDDRVSFNISHSGNLIAGVIAPHGNVGVDAEYIRPVDWKEYADCFTIQEWRAIALTDDPNRKLLEAWTKKESLVKADGRGLQITLTDVILGEESGVIAGEDKKWYIRQLPIQGHVVHVCSEFPIADVQMISGKENLMLNFDPIPERR